MGVPTPPIDITGSCSAIHNNTLYLFSPAGFQSIQLQDGASWTTLPSGISVTGGVCVEADSGPGDPSGALYIVGGRANSTQSQFSGLQKFSYATQQWQNISPVVPVTQNRAGHGASFLAESGLIAMYAGSQDPANTNPSSQSFLISTVPPFNVLSFTTLPPPLIQPQMMPWNASHALIVGGSADNKGLYLFGPQGFSGLGTSLAQPITSSATQVAIVTADDGSKVLQEYNLGVSPNEVTGYLLYANGQILPPGSLIGAAKPASHRMSRRQLTVNTWPAYNGTGAPTATRTSYSLAQNTNGVVVISGGDPSNPVVLFNDKQNAWVDPSSVFGAQQSQVPISHSASSASKTSAASSASATTSQAAAQGSSGHSNSLTILGAVLGTVVGIAAIIVLIMFCLKKRDKRSLSRHEQRELEDENANRLSFADQGTDYLPSAKSGKSFGDMTMNDSVTSLQIFQGQLAGHRRGQASDSSTAGLVYNKSPLGQLEPFEHDGLDPPRTGHGRSPSGGTQITQVGNGNFGAPTGMLPPLPIQDQERSAGWSQYFNNNDHLTNLGVQNQAQTQSFLNDGQSFRSSDMSASEYADNQSQRNTAAGMRPLELNLGPRFTSNRQSDQSLGVGRAVSTGSGYETSHYSTWTDDRASQVSGITPVPPIGSGPAFGNAFARPGLQVPTGNVATPVPRPSPGWETNDPLAYSAETVSTGSGSRTSDGRPAAAAQDFPMPKAYLPNESPKSPKSPGKGPTIRKMTGSEDMSWLNINAGRY